MPPNVLKIAGAQFLPKTPRSAPRLTIVGKEADNELFTPKAIIDWMPPIDLDVSWSPHCNVRPKYAMTIDDNALNLSWNHPDIHVIWMNPPYQNLRAWLAKAAAASMMAPYPMVICLVQAKPGERWFVDDVWPVMATVAFLKGRIVHDRPPWMGKSTPGTFNSCLAIFCEDMERVKAVQRQVADRARGHRNEPARWVWREREEP